VKKRAANHIKCGRGGRKKKKNMQKKGKRLQQNEGKEDYGTEERGRKGQRDKKLENKTGRKGTRENRGKMFREGEQKLKKKLGNTGEKTIKKEKIRDMGRKRDPRMKGGGCKNTGKRHSRGQERM